MRRPLVVPLVLAVPALGGAALLARPSGDPAPAALHSVPLSAPVEAQSRDGDRVEVMLALRVPAERIAPPEQARAVAAVRAVVAARTGRALVAAAPTPALRGQILRAVRARTGLPVRAVHLTNLLVLPPVAAG